MSSAFDFIAMGICVVFIVLPALSGLLGDILSLLVRSDSKAEVASGNDGWIFDFFLLDLLPFAFSSEDDPFTDDYDLS